KSDEKKAKKKNKPKGMNAKRFGIITFWFLFSFMLLVTIISISSSGGESSSAVTVENDDVFGDRGLAFSKDFVYYYFTWTTDKYGKEKRVENLKPYLAKGVDDLGGIVWDSDWESSVDKRDIVFGKTQKISENKARYVFKVKFTQRKKTDKKD